MECNNEAKLKEQNSSRLTDSKKGLVVTKGEGLGRADGEGRRRGLWGIMIGAHGIGSQGRQCSSEKTNRDSVASYCTDGQ